jgi:hypothetical protein
VAEREQAREPGGEGGRGKCACNRLSRGLGDFETRKIPLRAFAIRQFKSLSQMNASIEDTKDLIPAVASALPDARPVIFSMGFDEALVQRALAQAGGDHQATIDILIDGQLHPEESPYLSSSHDAPLPGIFSMGFNHAKVRSALASTGGNEERAADLLLLLCGNSSSSENTFVCPTDGSAAATAPSAPTVNFETEWLDELGCVCPKAVDYASQCPKGHTLAPLAGAGCGAAAQRVMCRICHTFTERDDALQWLVCSAEGCCAGYAVCDCCVRALQQAPAAAAGGHDFPLLVCGEWNAFTWHARRIPHAAAGRGCSLPAVAEVRARRLDRWADRGASVPDDHQAPHVAQPRQLGQRAGAARRHEPLRGGGDVVYQSHVGQPLVRHAGRCAALL